VTWRNLLRPSSAAAGRAPSRSRANVVPEVRGDESWLEAGGLPPRALQQLWFATLRAEWRSLVIVPAHADSSALPVAKALAAVGTVHLGSAVEVVDGSRSTLEGASAVAGQMNAKVSAGVRAIVPVDPLVTSLAGLPIALAADAVLLAVALGRGDLRSARKTLELLGEAKVLGAVAIRPARGR
jgi:hypothetical protein